MQRIFPERIAVPTRAYTPVVRADNWIYVSGQVPVTMDGSIVEGGIAEQAWQVFRNIMACLEASGATILEVVAMTVYLTDVRDIDAIDAAVRDVFTDGKYPTRTTLQVAALARQEYRVEISVVALRGASRDLYES